MKEFNIDKNITIKLEARKTVIYVGGKPFEQCKYLFLINPNEIKGMGEIDSIDEAEELIDSQLEEEITPEALGITPEEEFWGHCSNIQAWVEHNYDTRLLHSNLSFPLLEKLVELGDLQAKKIYKKEIIERYSSGVPSVQRFIKDMGYLDDFDFTWEEMIQLSLCDEHQEILKEIAEESKIDIDSLFFLLRHKYKKIVSLKIQRRNQTKNLPYSLVKLKDTLERLEISLNIKKLPRWIGELKKLEKLTIVGTPITGLPNSIGKLKELKELTISKCSLRNLPESIGDLKSLEKLNLRDNKIKTLPNSFSNIVGLKDLSLDSNPFESIPDSIRKLENLESIGLTRTLIKKVPEWLAEIPSLISIWASNQINKHSLGFKHSKKFHIINT